MAITVSSNLIGALAVIGCIWTVGCDRTVEAANHTKSTQPNPPITE